ncbi:methyltransferase domain-containing protein [Stenotrophomonas sp. C3(2023)]|uniref:class I SAM-dependent methyltransferase n=1 Tax=Stenotrophomonas sp. C3(2023) TaxID=3080277 RepID=UPI00293D0176|nr:methyltransferase domain-containing protein [Stenotrophomonas sp. C3(2023)]MDV3469692.1 methyltransferase domain-containing protein [Stenotrophomonas sp. C3(2023)]
MQPTSSGSTLDISPGAARASALRLLDWLPPGQVAVLGEGGTGITRGLRAMGLDIHQGPLRDSVAAAIVLVRHRSEGNDEATAQLAGMLGDFTGPVCLLIAGDAATTASRAFWERAMMALDWRKHPLNEVLAPYGELDTVAGVQLIGFESVNPEAREVYPLQALVEERDLHTDMTREPGRRSDAHMTRYAHAARFVRSGDRVIDVACGLGYGSYQVAHNCDAASFIGLDASEYAVNYAQLNFAAQAPMPMKFVLGDAQHLRDMADGSADFAVSVETLEHLPEPDLLLAELHRVLTTGGRVYASVPNDWSDESGEDPNPFHFHVYDWKRLRAQFNRNGFEIERAWLQDAGGGQKRHTSTRSMLEVDPERGPACDGEWLLVLARKKGGEELNALERLREALRLGALQGVDEVLARIETEGEPLDHALAHGLHGWTLLAQRDAGATAAWARARDAARQALGSDGAERDAASILALSSDAMHALAGERATAGLLGRLVSAHGRACQLLGLDGPWSVDVDDRAVVAGAAEGDDPVNLGARELRALIDAKEWLDGKFHEHVERIAHLESQASELERARRWLDEQYHELTAEVARLSGNASQ